MMVDPCSRQMRQIYDSASDWLGFYTKSEWARRRTDPSRPPKFDFVTGNPYTMPLPEISAALQRAAVAQNKDWFGYKMSEPPSRKAAAAALRERVGVPFADEDVHMTAGGFAAILAALRNVVDPGDEVIVTVPMFFYYEAMVMAVGGKPVRVPAKQPSFDLDLDAIRNSITARTRVVLVNTPHNPSGRIYPPEVLTELAQILERASAEHGHRIYILSDEAFSRIIYSGHKFHSPTKFYPHTFLAYTYGKTLLMPGERIGYVAVPETMPAADRAVFRDLLEMALAVHGWCFPNGTLQLALPELEPLVVDLAHLQRNRDTLVNGLRDIGYTVSSAQGTFFLLVKAPWEDDKAFAELLSQWDIWCLPGSFARIPGHLRISLCSASVEGSLSGFKAAHEHATKNPR
jgi:aspartate aminotransferase